MNWLTRPVLWLHCNKTHTFSF